MNTKQYCAMISFVLYLMLAGCSSPVDVAGGGGGEIPNGLHGSLIYGNGEPSVNAEVFLISDQIAVDSTFSNENGGFTFLSVNAGIYAIEAFNDKGYGIIVDTVVIHDTDKTIILAPLNLVPSSALTGIIHMPPDVRSNAVMLAMGNAYHWKLSLDSSGIFMISNILDIGNRYFALFFPDTTGRISYGCKFQATIIAEDTIALPDTIYPVPVNPSIPKVNAGSDTIVSISSMVFLHGTAIDTSCLNSFVGKVYSTIEKVEWAIGLSAPFIRTGSQRTGIRLTTPVSNDTSFIAPDRDTLLHCIMRATNTMGISASDTVIITVRKP